MSGPRGNYFNRHLFKAGLQCKTKLYYKAHKFAENENIQPILKNAGFNKYYFKMLAGRHYPDAHFVREKTKAQAANTTARLLQQRPIVIKEAVFIADDCYAKVPILVASDGEITLIDVQTKAFHRGKHRLVNQQGRMLQKWKPYIINLAYKYSVIRQCYPRTGYRMKLIFPDKTKAAGKDQLLQRISKNEDLTDDLCCTIEVTSLVHQLHEGKWPPFRAQSFEERLTELKNQYQQAAWQASPIGKKCKRCEFRISPNQQKKGAKSGFHRCWSASKLADNYKAGDAPVIDLIGGGKNALLARDMYLQRSVPAEKLQRIENITIGPGAITQKQRQTLQVRKARGLPVPHEVVKPRVWQEISQWSYPIHFLDFEAGNYAVPVHRGNKPYALVLFQYSCHTLYENGTCEHHQWIARNAGEYPNFAIVSQLLQVPQIQQGTIVQYSTFEHQALKKIRRQLVDEADSVINAGELINGLNRLVDCRKSSAQTPPYIVDISRLVRFYYNAFMEGSLSIKSVVQAVLSVSNFLKQKYRQPYSSANFKEIEWWQWDKKSKCARNPYLILRERQQAETVGDGTKAMLTYGRMLTNSLSPQKKQQAVDSLLKYCELDTLSMMMLFEHWQSLNE